MVMVKPLPPEQMDSFHLISFILFQINVLNVLVSTMNHNVRQYVRWIAAFLILNMLRIKMCYLREKNILMD